MFTHTRAECYAIATECAKELIRKGYNKLIWIAPIPDEDKERIWNNAKKKVEEEKARETEPLLF